MTEKPILFNTEMVKAILDGRKTQTRRVMKPQPEKLLSGWLYDDRSFADDEQMQSHLFHNVYGEKGSPYGGLYSTGEPDTLWVRETWQAQNHAGQWWHEVHRDNRQNHNWAIIDKATQDPDLPPPPRWIPSIFMPRWASRITLEVTNVRIERVQDITNDDAIAEGIAKLPESNSWKHCEYIGGHCYGTPSPVASFAKLWNSINAKRGYSWDSNPWVWVVEFEAVI